MIFTRDNVEKIARGVKTESRRVWETPHVRIGGVYAVRSSRFSAHVPGDPMIRVTNLWKEPLGQIDEADARAEGCDSVDDFKRLWTSLHGSWRPGQRVYVVRFEPVRRLRVPDTQVAALEGGPVILSESPDGFVQIDVGTPDGGLVYAELSDQAAARLGRALLAAAERRFEAWKPPARR
jgi:hypothetical protein